MSRHRLPVVLAALAALIVPSLAGAQSWQGRENVVEGVPHVMNPAAGILPAQTLPLKEVWRLGGFSDAEEEFFGVISDVAIDARDNIYLLDSQLAEIKVFDPSGAYLRTIGREGEGPGEFRRPVGLTFMPDGKLGVVQPFPGRIILFKPDGAPAGEFPFTPEQGGGFVAMSAARSAGDRLAVVYSTGEPKDGAFTRREYLALATPDGSSATVLSQFESRMEFANSHIVEKDWNRFTGSWSASPAGRVCARTGFDEYAVTVWKADGAVDRVIRREYAPHPRSKKDLERIEKAWARGISRWVQDPSFTLEKNWSPVENVYAREDGSVWVRTSRGARDLDPGVLASFDVFDAEGRYVQELTFTGDFDPDNDGLFLNEEFLIVVTDLISAREAMMGGVDDEEDFEEEPEPMSVICYQIDLSAVASR